MVDRLVLMDLFMQSEEKEATLIKIKLAELEEKAVLEIIMEVMAHHIMMNSLINLLNID